MSKKTIQEINKHNDELAILSSADRINRARSITVGTAFNGVTEIVMRGDGKYIFSILQPTEVIELIHQLAANVGCHINIQPRNDFASWRQWREERPATPGLSFPPMANSPPISTHPPLANQIKTQEVGSLALRSESNEQTVATQKTVGRKRTKRAAAAA